METENRGNEGEPTQQTKRKIITKTLSEIYNLRKIPSTRTTRKNSNKIYCDISQDNFNLDKFQITTQLKWTKLAPVAWHSNDWTINCNAITDRPELAARAPYGSPIAEWSDRACVSAGPKSNPPFSTTCALDCVFSSKTDVVTAHFSASWDLFRCSCCRAV